MPQNRGMRRMWTPGAAVSDTHRPHDELSQTLMTTLELSQMLKVPVGTLRQWRHRGYGPRGFALGGTVRYRRSAVEKWVAEQEAAETAGAA